MATTDITGTSNVYPSENAIETTAGRGARGSEFYHASYANGWVDAYVQTGLALSTSGTLACPVSAGTFYVDGRSVATPSTTIACVDNQTNYIFSKITVDGSGNANAVYIESNTTGTPPAQSVLLGTAVAVAGAITSVQDRRKLVPVRDVNVLPRQLNTYFGESRQTLVVDGTMGETVVAAVTVTPALARYQNMRIRMLGTLDVTAVAGANAVVRFKHDGATDRSVTLAGGQTLYGWNIFRTFAETFNAGASHTYQVTFDSLGVLVTDTISGFAELLIEGCGAV